VACGSVADFEGAFGESAAATPLGDAVRLFFANGGTEALAVHAADGAQALRDADFNLLNLTDPGPGALAEAARLCLERRAVLIAEPPASATDAGAAAAFAEQLAVAAGQAAMNIALYFPRVLLADGEAAAGGAVAGLIARTDAAQGVWSAPAGSSHPLADVGEPALRLDGAELEDLSERGVNCLRSFAGVGTVVWGARTLAVANDASSEWKYVTVRRLAIYLEESLDKGLGWAVFEPSGEELWLKVRQAVESFLDSLFREGAFPANKPEDAYFARCDRTTMTQDDVDNGRLVVLVGFAPLRPAEFVVIRICMPRCASP
jgi:phage tail sheath protein FI